ncbi:sigma-70 family RNA polymerase sigma factor [Planctomicrobium sp. SH661]|uniref:sigma-70 family RNA polymerase sigma factor n=1 Tax=Planctomicrobium sp. SH661 TaxID=3448124 RepID=UPI003F5BBD0A
MIESTLAGNRDAFGELMLKHQDRLYGTLVQLLGSVHDARDVGQDAFLLAYEKLGTFRQEASFYAWLFRIAYNAAISSRRRKQTRHSLDEYKERVGVEPEDDRASADPTRNLQTDDAQRQVRAALDQLGTEYRDAIVLKEIEGLSYEEIAELSGCPIGTVRSRIHRARQLLRERLARVVERELK